MRKQKVYLDNCCFNRPYDDQQQLKIELETKAKLFIQSLVALNMLNLTWSYILDYENSRNSYMQKALAIQKWQVLAVEAERFISLLHVESFDYTEWRRENMFRNMTVEELSSAAMEHRRNR